MTDLLLRELLLRDVILSTLTPEQLTERNIALGDEVQRIKTAQRAIGAELDKRAHVERSARAILGLPDEHQAVLRPGLPPEIVTRLEELREAEANQPEAQTVKPDGIESGEVVGSPGGRDGFDQRWEGEA